MRSVLLSVILLAASATAYAQASYDEIAASPDKAGSLYYLYPVSESSNTKAPKGYKPFYINHYGRHGSRYLVNDADYTAPLETLRAADKAGALSDKGRDVMKRLEVIWADAEGRTGELTRIGARQHHDIAQRMYKSFPGVFTDDAVISAISTTRMRCAHSMAAFCEGLKELNPKLYIPRESAKRYMSYMSNVTPQASEFNRWDGPAGQRTVEFDNAMSNPDRLMGELFDNVQYLADNRVDTKALMRQLFLIAIDMPNTECDERLDDLFTTGELFDQWRAINHHYYNHMSNPPSANGAVLDNARPLLANLLASADTMIASGRNGADLRFGHDSCIVPLLGLMKVDGCYGASDDPYSLHEVYADFKISPMAANLQMVFFRNKKGDVIVKLMLNEREVSLPVATDIAPFYHWNDLRDYLYNILSEK